uniref:V-type proton ATPase subunit a n=1 Tax=Denticeps clupeoides TaxID=299321 RepID=A0AAY4C0X0_9TELE
MGSLFRSEEVCLVQLFLQSDSAYNCVSELGELGIVEFRDLNPNVNAFQRKFVGEVRRCEEMEKTFGESTTSITGKKTPQLARELKEVAGHSCNRTSTISLLCFNIGPTFVPLSQCSGSWFWNQYVRLSFVAGVVHPWKVPAFERLLWRACRGYIIVDFRDMEEKLELPETGDLVQWKIFLISYWGDQIGQKVKKICDCFHTQTFAYPEGVAERGEILSGLQGRIEDIRSVMSETEQYLQQLLLRALVVLPQWKVRVQKCKAVHLVLNLCSPSVTEKCLIAEAWCPVNQLPAVQSALREGGRKSGSGVDSFYNRLPTTVSPPTLFPTNSFTAGFQNIVDAYGVASYREVNPALYTTITFPFLFAVMFGDVGHGLLMAVAALWMVLEEKDPKLRNNTNEIWRMLFGGRYLILLMGLFSVYTGAIYNECFSRRLSPFTSSWHIAPMATHYNWTPETLQTTPLLTLDPNITGVFTGPYPFGIDPVWGLASNQLTFLNSYKMKMSVIIGIIHMTFGVSLSFFNYMCVCLNSFSSVFLVLIPELVFMLCLFGYLVFMVIFKWIAYGPADSNTAPSILIHFIDMFLFVENKENPNLFEAQPVVQKILVVVALCSVPVLLLGKPIHQYVTHRRRRTYHLVNVSQRMAIVCTYFSSYIQEFDATNEFMHQAIHTIEYCLGCISNTASYLRLWALSLAHAQLSEVLWTMVMRNGLSSQSYMGSVFLSVVFAGFAVLTVSILLVMEGLSAFLHALRLHWVEFQNKFYSGTGYKLNPFCFIRFQTGFSSWQ